MRWYFRLPKPVKVSLNAFPELILSQSRFEIDRNTHRPFDKGIHDGQTHQERYGSAETEVGDHHFPSTAFNHRRSGLFASDPPSNLFR